MARPLTDAVKNSRLVLVSLGSRFMSPMALEFAEHCRSFFGVAHAHARAPGTPPWRQYAPGNPQN